MARDRGHGTTNNSCSPRSGRLDPVFSLTASNGDNRRVRKGFRALVVTATLTACVGCSGGSSPTSSVLIPAPREPAGSIQAAAISWARAFLTGTPVDIKGMEGGQCTANSPTYSPTFLAAYLKAERENLERSIGMPIDRLRITAVDTLNVTATQGQAEVQYNLPISSEGKDNWVTYQIENGRWKETNCHAPIGGESQSPTAESQNATTVGG